MNIKEKIEEMRRISQEIEKELEPAMLSFSWYIKMYDSTIEDEARTWYHQFKGEMIEYLAEAGVLPRKDGPAAETAPDQE
jgi:hypothetical protein